MAQLIEKLIPDPEHFNTYEEYEGTRMLKSSASRKRQREFKKLKAKQDAKEGKIIKDKLKDKDMKEKRRSTKELAKQKEEEDRKRKYKNRRSQNRYPMNISASK